MMKKYAITACSLLVFVSMAIAQDAEMKVMQEYFNMEKKAAVAGFMKLDTQYEVAFWTVYDQYENERRSLGNERIRVIQEYAQAYPNVSNDQVDTWMKSINSRKASEVKLQKKYYKLLAKETSPIIALQYFQIDAYISSIVNYQLLESIPFLGEM